MIRPKCRLESAWDSAGHTIMAHSITAGTRSIIRITVTAGTRSTIRITDTGGIRSGMVMGTSIIRTTHTIHRITPTLRGITTTVITGQRITGWAVWQATGA